MKITLYGASGMIGSRILNELLSRRHDVLAVVRHPSKITRTDVEIRAGDVLDPHSVLETAKRADAVISAYASPEDAMQKLVEATRSLLSALEQTGIQRFLMVGGAGNLEVAPGVPIVDTPKFSSAVDIARIGPQRGALGTAAVGPRLDEFQPGGTHPTWRTDWQVSA